MADSDVVEAPQGRACPHRLPRGFKALHLTRVAHAAPRHPAEHASLSRPDQVAYDDRALPTSLCHAGQLGAPAAAFETARQLQQRAEQAVQCASCEGSRLPTPLYCVLCDRHLC
eukprot:972590-Prorocentrum_minimum.AAC.1